MKNIKVNYRDLPGNKRTSTTINGAICWAYFKQTDTYKNNEGDSSSVTRCIQDFVNSISLSSGAVHKSMIESLLINHIMLDEFERGVKCAIDAANRRSKVEY